MLSYIPRGVEIPRQPLLNGAVCNDDGHGWAIADSTDLIIGKNMNYTKAIDEFIAARKERPDSAAIFHSRFATHGFIGEYNTHPFHVSDNAVMAHNGIMPTEFQPAKGDKRSDTRVFADLVREKFVNNPNGLPSKRAAQRIAGLIGRGNKLVFLASTPAGPRVRIVNEQAGYASGGVWYSNSDYKGWKSYLGGDYGWSNFYKSLPKAAPVTTPAVVLPFRPQTWSPPDSCPVCGSYYVDVPNQICKVSVCHACLNCAMHISECECNIPAAKDTPWWNEGEEIDV